MNIKDAELRIEILSNDLEYLILRKKELFEATQPTSIPLKQDLVSGGSRVDKYDNYIIKSEELDPKIDKLNNEIFRLKHWIENELKIIGEFDELTQWVVKHKDQDKMTWNQIEIALYDEGKGISVRTARRLYGNYKMIRYDGQQ